MAISQGLSEALQRYRDETKVKVIWIDQISIDQTNDLEKSAQVRRMGRIFSAATQVVVWLGEEDVETAQVFQLLTDVARQIRGYITQRTDAEDFPRLLRTGTNYYALQLSAADSPEWTAFRKLTSRKWFTRSWTFQELVLSSQAVLKCGSYSIPWVQFFVICERVQAHDEACLPAHESHLKDSFSHIRSLATTNIYLSQKDSQASKTPGMERSTELLNLVFALRKNKTTKPMDKIFSLWGCANDKDTTIQASIDYSVPFEKTYIIFAKWFINRYTDLLALRLTNITENLGILPSWTPDFHKYDRWNSLRVDFGPNLLPHGHDRMYNATGSSTASVSLNHAPELHLRGVYVGMIATLSEPAGNLLKHVGIGGNVVTGGLWHRTASTAFSSGVYPPTGESVELAYHRLRIGDHVQGEILAEHRRRRLMPLTSLPEPGEVTYSNAIGLITAAKDDIGMLILKWTTRQRFYITDTGYMGLAHRSCQAGDHVYLLMGGDMPFILRRNAHGTYQFKGESYVHGIMDGEYLLNNFKPSRGADSITNDSEWLARLNRNPLPFATEEIVLV